MKKRRGLVFALIFGFLTFVFGALLFASETGFLVRKSLDNLPASAKVLIQASNDGNVGEIKVGEILNEIDSDADYDEDLTLSEFVYDNLSDEQKETISQDDVDEIFESTKDINDYAAGVLEDYSSVLLGESETASINTDDIVELIEDNENSISKVIGRDLTDSDYERVEEVMDEHDIEEKTTLSREKLLDSNLDEEDMELIEIFYSSNDVINLVLIAIMVVCVILILLFNLHKPYRVFGIPAVTTLIVGIGAYAVTFFSREQILSQLDNRESFEEAILSGLVKAVNEAIKKTAKIYIIVGIILLVVYILVRILFQLFGNKADDEEVIDTNL